MGHVLPTRRALLGGGSLLIGFALFARPGALAATETAAKSVAADQVDSYLAIGADGRVTVFSGKVDLGTGIRTALTQMAAEELDVPIRRVTVVQGDTLLTPDQGPTYGSLSIQNGGVAIRQAAATARRQLIAQAAQHLGVPADQLTVVEGMVQPRSGGAGVSYGELVGGGDLTLKLDKEAPTKDPARFTLVGTSVPRLDIPGKATGQFTYMQDFKVEGMLHARVVRPPAIGATLQAVDEASVAHLPGPVQIVREGNFLAVVAPSEWGAIKAAETLKATWSDWQGLPEQSKLWEHVRGTKVVKDDVTSTVGDTQAGMVTSTGGHRLTATYEYPIHTHGSIGPSCAIAELRAGKLTVWTASQMTHQLRKQLAAMIKLPEGDVRCIYMEGSGCYGRNGHEDAAADATLLARATGKPVRVQWSRADEHGWDPKGPPTLIDLRATLGADGNVAAWESEFFIPQGAAGNVELVAATLAGLPHETAMAPGNIIGNSALPYAFPNIKTVCHRLETTPFRPSWIRTPGRMQNTFANECFLDELAAAAGADPVEYRLRVLRDPRGAELLERLVALSNWQARPSPAGAAGDEIVRGRGMSYVKYELVRTYVGAVAEVEVNRSTGQIRLARVFIAHDCGQIINPDGLRNQLEGNVIQTASRTLKEEVAFDRGRVTSLDWASYPISTFPEVPHVTIELIDRPTEKPWGGGEPASAVVPSAISNAVFDATGVRLRTAPFTPNRVKAAMRSI